MALNNNTPNSGYIYIENLTVTYDNNTYAINNIYTDKRYVYFNSKDTSNLYISDKRVIDDTLFFIIKNNNGNGLLISNSKVKLVFDNFDKEAIVDDIYIVKGNMEENSAFIKNVNDNVESLSDTYKKSQDFNEIKENFNTSAVNYNSLLIGLNTILINFLNDGKFISSEKATVNTELDNIKNKSVEALAYADALLDLAVEYNNADDVSRASQYKIILISLLSKLETYVLEIIDNGDENLTVSDISDIRGCLSSMINNLSSLKEECNQFIFLGAGGTIADQIYSAHTRIDNVVTNLQEIQASVLSSLDTEKQTVQSYFDDMKTFTNGIVNITNVINNTVDRKVTTDQLNSIGSYIQRTINTSNEIKSRYEIYYGNENLSSNMKVQLKESFDTFMKDIDDLKIASKDNLSDKEMSYSDFNAFSKALANHRASRSDLNSKILYCIGLIDNQTSNAVLKQIRDDFEKKIQALEKRIEALEGK